MNLVVPPWSLSVKNYTTLGPRHQEQAARVEHQALRCACRLHSPYWRQRGWQQQWGHAG